LLKGLHTGVEHYISNLLRNVARYDSENEYIFYVNKAYRGNAGPVEGPHIRKGRVLGTNRAVRFVWEQLYLPVLLAKDDIDVFHAPGYIMPLLTTVPSVVTIHDTIAMQYPEYCLRSNLLHYRMFLPPTVARARRIITTTEYSKRDIVATLGAAADTIDVIPLGVHHSFAPVEDESLVNEVVNRYGLPARIILFVGNLEPKKNIARIIDAFDALRTRVNVPHALVIVGRKGWLYKRLVRKVRSLGLERRVIFLGNVPLPDLVLLYNAADVFVFPSLYEGFGIPPLEAMACGTPVVASNAASLPEVVGDAAITVDPRDTRGIGEAVYAVVTDDGLRRSLREKGLKRARPFTWERTARKTVEVYRKVKMDRHG
jgi:glycosyltransferase involved in cell wall biosynthesis